MSVFCFYIFSICLLTVTADQKDKCTKCMPAEECPLFGNMGKQVQTTWNEQFPCNEKQDEGDTYGSPFGFASMAKGDYICCPESNIWGIDDSNKPTDEDFKDNRQQQNDQQSNGQTTHIDNDQNLSHENRNSEIDSNEGDQYEQSRIPIHGRFKPQFNRGSKRPQKLISRPFDRNNFNGHYENYPNAYGNNPPYSGNNRNMNGNINNPNFNRHFPNGNGNNQNFNTNYPNLNNPNPNFAQNNPNYNRNVPNNRNNQNVNGVGGNRNIQNQGSLGNTNRNNGQVLGGQCSALTSFPTDPQTGCCGREEILSDRIAGQQNFPRVSNSNRNLRNPPTNSWSYPGRFARQAAGDVEFSLDNRIAGGKETEFEQFPWTVLLKTTFDYGNKKAAFNCGGSLISARYVLTAAHCVSEDGARVSDIEVNLAEYDKRTFPQDCKNILGEGRKCIENIVMHAEDIIAHPDFDDRRLQNDIALIRLRGNAPYTDYIRPICLPPINIDNPDYSDLRLAVAGWGRNGSIVSQVKQSTVVNLVPQHECISSYPQLTKKHLCAAGRSGEDTCKGDSGGPLMMLYEGKYFVSGLVSGKRADSPCGTSVPSLYTNVYQYIDWIKSKIRN